jgi:hypothetical protein
MTVTGAQVRRSKRIKYQVKESWAMWAHFLTFDKI